MVWDGPGRWQVGDRGIEQQQSAIDFAVQINRLRGPAEYAKPVVASIPYQSSS